MSDMGKQVRMNRIFRHAEKRILSVAADHMINYRIGMPEPLRDIESTIAGIVAGLPSAITLNKGVAKRCFAAYAGQIPLIIQQMALTPDRPGFVAHASVDEVVALGADAIAVAIFVKHGEDLENMRQLADTVREADRYGLPVVPHIYPLVLRDGAHAVSNDPEDVFYAARVGVEMGADFIKVPYTGNPKTFGEIVAMNPVPIVASGGPRCETVEDAVAMMRAVAQSGAAGATVGRNAWGFGRIPETIQSLKLALGIGE